MRGELPRGRFLNPLPKPLPVLGEEALTLFGSDFQPVSLLSRIPLDQDHGLNSRMSYCKTQGQ